MKELGIISGYEDYRALPATVLMDARLLIEGEVLKQQRQESSRGNRR